MFSLLFLVIHVKSGHSLVSVFTITMLALYFISPSAGPLALARDILDADSSPFFVLNSDVICNYPFTKMLEVHKAHGKEGTIVVSSIKCCIYDLDHLHSFFWAQLYRPYRM